MVCLTSASPTGLVRREDPAGAIPARSRRRLPHPSSSGRSGVTLPRGERRSANRTRWSGCRDGEPEEEARDASETTEASETAAEAVARAAASPAVQAAFAQADQLALANTRRVQAAFRRLRLAPYHFQGSTGYGHGDPGRPLLEEAWAEVLGTESALVTPRLVSGTHAIAAALFAVLRPGDVLIVAAGKPYDTLDQVLGVAPGQEKGEGEDRRPAVTTGSLADLGVETRIVPLLSGGRGVDVDAVAAAVGAEPRARVVHVQRSCGYDVTRPTLTAREVGVVATAAKAAAAAEGREVLVLVDNCYGERRGAGGMLQAERPPAPSSAPHRQATPRNERVPLLSHHKRGACADCAGTEGRAPQEALGEDPRAHAHPRRLNRRPDSPTTHPCPPPDRP